MNKYTTDDEMFKRMFDWGRQIQLPTAHLPTHPLQAAQLRRLEIAASSLAAFLGSAERRAATFLCSVFTYSLRFLPRLSVSKFNNK